jgi:hypothetical protein
MKVAGRKQEQRKKDGWKERERIMIEQRKNKERIRKEKRKKKTKKRNGERKNKKKNGKRKRNLACFWWPLCLLDTLDVRKLAVILFRY